MRVFYSLAIFSGLLLNISICAEGKVFKGPFRAEAMAFYIVHKGGPLKITVDVFADKGKELVLLPIGESLNL